MMQRIGIAFLVIIGAIIGIATCPGTSRGDVDAHEIWASNTTEEIQNELGNCTEGDSVYFNGSARYTLTAALTLGVNVSINGSEGTIIAGTTFGCFVANSSVNVSISHVNLTTTTASAISMPGAEGNASLSNMNITTTTGKALNMVAAGNLAAENVNHTTTSGQALVKSGVGNITVMGMNYSASTGFSTGAIVLTANGNISVTRLTSAGWGGAMISNSKDGNISITNSNITTSFSSSAYGVYASGLSAYNNITVEYCNFSTAASRGALMKGFGNITATNCNFNTTTSFGLSHIGTGEIIFANCNFNVTSSGGAGVIHTGTGNITGSWLNITTTISTGIVREGYGNLSLSNYTYYGSTGGSAVSLSSYGNITMQDCNIDGGYFIVMEGEGNISIERCNGSASVDGISSDSFSGVKNVLISVTDCAIDAGQNVILQSNNGNVSVIRSNLSGLLHGISLGEIGNIVVESSNITVSDNNILSSCIYISGSANVSASNTNMISDSRGILTVELIYHPNANQITVNNCNFGTSDSSIVVTNLNSDVTCSNSTIISDSRGIAILSYGNIVVENTTISASEIGVYIYANGAVTISNSTLSSSISSAIYRNGGLLDATIENCNISSTGYGIYWGGAGNVNINYSYIHGTLSSVSVASGYVYLSNCSNQTVRTIVRFGAIWIERGMSLFTLPFNSTLYTNASNITALDGVFYISRFNKTSNGWDTLFRSGAGVNFAITYGEGYILYTTAGFLMSFEEPNSSTSANFSINDTGLALIGNPTTSEITVSEFTGNSTTILYCAIWDGGFTHFEVYFISSGGPDVFTIPAYSCAWVYLLDETTISYGA